ncbi:hypothetical protein BJ138DRAFT_1108252 [Hygrophoropsis aurantiaca]|uniref:Uncharacterized protein n=1 Tax=Hygrophoropsis aurantiaca TaxID=72124 RepID=A0ACB7ZNU9_9AGAM|nr:hypothetical protein BJ138DRAFT_1108252 [Hygrophoropsis aurantiaca]
MLAKSEAQTRQVLVDNRSMGVNNGLKDHSEAELVKKADLALEMMASAGIHVPEGAVFLSTRKLWSGCMLYETGSAAHAKWLNNKDTRKSFLEHFDPDATIRERLMQIVVEYIPTSFDTDSQASLEEAARKSGLEPGDIAKARWIKPLHRRAPNQRTAHAIVLLTSKTAANTAIRQGLVMGGRNDTCGTCAEEHRTSECDNEDITKRYCVNCQAGGHTAWDRECPEFVKQQQKITARSQEAKYRYFLTEDPASWGLIPDVGDRWAQGPQIGTLPDQWTRNLDRETQLNLDNIPDR